MLPQFSLRVVLLLLTGAAALSAVVARAVQGDAWALGVAAAVLWAALAFVVHAAFYLAAIGVSGLERAAGRAVDAPSADREPAEAPE